jgi:hypothetical protein
MTPGLENTDRRWLPTPWPPSQPPAGYRLALSYQFDASLDNHPTGARLLIGPSLAFGDRHICAAERNPHFIDPSLPGLILLAGSSMATSI